MTLPKTLRDVAGLGAEAPALRGSVLVMIDLQNTYREGVMRLEDVEPAIAEAARLLRRARETDVPVIHVQHNAGAGSPYDIGARIGAIADEVAPQAEEAVIVKGYPNAFIGTDLQEQLQRSGAKDIILAGFMTHMCVNSTARGAFNLGFRPTVVANTTATRDLPDGNGGVVRAPALQAASLAAMADLFAVVVGSADDLRG